MTITLIIQFQVKPEKLAEFSAILATVKNELPGKGGCKAMRVLQGADDPHAITLVEEWASRALHHSHFEAIVASGDWNHIQTHLAAAPVSQYYNEL
ncbi:antibiotic biosynthesis monooxygenase family protein [Phyllobacterium sp. YR531]|uniref:putative quinol monooxygenase n=1 Tax=Phyllobacterium sp. YR531 TaxID=1144343 RepID=UPI00026F876D|nr:antibiotic biosynthesis monooxygenase family protein [Phyllobacterium sp. YR531]EJN01367.1 hypothetical protein PMI41_03449 [Phyllobacterium sp. YR531]